MPGQALPPSWLIQQYLEEVLAGVYQGKLGTQVLSLCLAPSHPLDKLRNVIGNILWREEKQYLITWGKNILNPNCKITHAGKQQKELSAQAFKIPFSLPLKMFCCLY